MVVVFILFFKRNLFICATIGMAGFIVWAPDSLGVLSWPVRRTAPDTALMLSVHVLMVQ